MYYYVWLFLFQKKHTLNKINVNYTNLTFTNKNKHKTLFAIRSNFVFSNQVK
jgi:hypothetical protein